MIDPLSSASRTISCGLNILYDSGILDDLDIMREDIDILQRVGSRYAGGGFFDTEDVFIDPFDLNKFVFQLQSRMSQSHVDMDLRGSSVQVCDLFLDFVQLCHDEAFFLMIHVIRSMTKRVAPNRTYAVDRYTLCLYYSRRLLVFQAKNGR